MSTAVYSLHVYWTDASPDESSNSTLIGVFSSRKKAKAYLDKNYIFWTCDNELFTEPVSSPDSDYFVISKNYIDGEPDQEITAKRLLRCIRQSFDLSKEESSILRKYVKYMHDDAKDKFLRKILNSDREYLNKFLNTEVDELEGEMFGSDEDDEERIITFTHQDLNPVTRLELYTRLLDKLRGDEKQIKKWYKKLNFRPDTYEDDDKIKRKALYSKFKEWLDSIDDEELQELFTWVRG